MCFWRRACSRPRMGDRAAPRAPGAIRRATGRRVSPADSRRSGAPAVTDKSPRLRPAIRPAARPHPQRAAKACGGEVSCDHLVGGGEQGGAARTEEEYHGSSRQSALKTAPGATPRFGRAAIARLFCSTCARRSGHFVASLRSELQGQLTLCLLGQSTTLACNAASALASSASLALARFSAPPFRCRGPFWLEPRSTASAVRTFCRSADAGSAAWARNFCRAAFLAFAAALRRSMKSRSLKPAICFSSRFSFCERPCGPRRITPPGAMVVVLSGAVMCAAPEGSGSPF